MRKPFPILFTLIVLLSACATPETLRGPVNPTEAESISSSTPFSTSIPKPAFTATSPNVFPDQPAPEPQGKILLSTQDIGLWMANPDGSDQQILVPAPVGLGTLSPDGKSLAYEIRAEIHVLDLQTGQDTLLTGPAFSFPHWSPDGSQMGFECPVEAYVKICVLDANGANLRIYGEGHEHQRHFFGAWNREGTKISFTMVTYPPGGGRGRGTIQILDLNTGEISLVIDESALENIAWIGNPVFSPDGTHMRFTGEQGGVNSLFSIDLQTKEIGLIEQETYDLSGTIWSPDGQFFFSYAGKPLLFSSTGEFLEALDIPGGVITSWVVPMPSQLTSLLPPEQVTGYQTQVVNGIEIELRRVQVLNKYLQAVICFQLPDDADWLPGDKAEDLILNDGQNLIPTWGYRLLEMEPSTEGARPRRCDAIQFPITKGQDLNPLTLTIHRLVTSIPEVPDCDLAQKKLDAAGIVIQCTHQEGYFGYEILHKPDWLTELQAREQVHEAFMDIIEGPWVFEVHIEGQ